MVRPCLVQCEREGNFTHHFTSCFFSLHPPVELHLFRIISALIKTLEKYPCTNLNNFVYFYTLIVFTQIQGWVIFNSTFSVSMEISLRAGRLVFNSRQWQWWDFLLFSTASRPALGSTRPPIHCVPGAPFPVVQRLWREANHSPLSVVDIKHAWSYTSTPPVRFHSVVLK
jgi:hypothetical protein